MAHIRSDAQYDCHRALADATSEQAKWELTELDCQLAWEWTRRELSLIMSSTALEDILRRRMEVCINKVTKAQENGRLEAWMRNEFDVGQRKRLEEEREQQKERMEKEMKGASERAERGVRPWSDQGRFAPPWEAGLEFIDKQWSAGIKGGHSVLKNAEAVVDLDKLIAEKSPKPLSDAPDQTRRISVTQVRERFGHWHHQRENERLEMDATIQRLSDDCEHPGDAYQYPGPDYHWQATTRFANHHVDKFLPKVCSATVYDAEAWVANIIYEVIQKSTTRSVINVDPVVLDSIPENDHLLYLDSAGGNEPGFVQRNRDRWWSDQQTSNSSTFYLSPENIAIDRNSVTRYGGTIAHIFIFLETPSRIRLRLLHSGFQNTSVSIQENKTELHLVGSNEIPNQLQLQDFELDQFASGRHELELVVMGGVYFLRDIFVEFFEHGGQDAEPSRTEDAKGKEDRNANF
ncbi:hypothetical protein GALMADRAFT_1217114 [Galerina marginata CBS 339.88]|uniref:Uncharacterized protein n=1 Tax=Galerina marginata (strain CBS 339.88) TaxID=685588 RepID=A0A067SDM6_GALM3|nr:hypothetical protein GALMADRAFT_1217114 [Galerina marginata CBS 339.88]